MDNDDIISLAESYAGNTPTQTSVTDIPIHTKPSHAECPPWPGNTYIISSQNDDLVVALEDGRLVLQRGMNPQGGFHWLCEERNGWLGFKNVVSGTYIGHNTGGGFWCKYGHHEPDESFCARHHPDGGYVLLVRHKRDHTMVKMDIGKDGESLVEVKNGGTPWRFVKV